MFMSSGGGPGGPRTRSSMGGMGGFPGMQGGFPGMGGADGGMPGMGGGGRRSMPQGHPPGPPQKAPAIQRPLLVTLEDLYTGTTKRLKITRQRGGQAEDKVRAIGELACLHMNK